MAKTKSPIAQWQSRWLLTIGSLVQIQLGELPGLMLLPTFPFFKLKENSKSQNETLNCLLFLRLPQI